MTVREGPERRRMVTMSQSLSLLDFESGLHDQLFRNLMENANDSIVLLNEEGVILYCNQQTRKITGYSKEQMKGRRYLEFVHPDDSDQAMSEMGKIVGGMSSHCQIRLRHFDGRTIHMNFSAILAEMGNVKVIMTIGRDVTEAIQAQEALRKSEQNFETIIREMPEGVLITDRERMLFANQALAKMLGFESPAEIVGRKVLELIHEDDRPLIRKRIDRVLDLGEANPLAAIKVIGKSGNIIDAESSSIPIQFYEKSGLMAVIRDVTVQHRMERQASLNDKLATVGTLAAGVAHEVNNPLTYVLGNLVFLNDQLADLKRNMGVRSCQNAECSRIFNEMQQEIGDVTRGAERIRDIVKGLKTFVRGNDEETTKVDLNQILESAINMTFHEIKKKARLEKDFAADLPPFTANPGKLQQVFINLLINAAQAISGNDPEHNKIHIRTGRENATLYAEIMDTGCGIPEEVLPRIFDPFYTTKPIGVGTGLGLSVCNEIVRQFHGSLEVNSQVEVGSIFTVRIPADEDSCRRLEPIVPSVSGVNSHPEKKVLIVDDEPGSLDVLGKVLKKNSDVLAALSGAEALSLLRKKGGRVEAIVSDINMPGMSGIEFYARVASEYPGLEKRFVFITGGGCSKEVKDFLDGIPNPCLEKPFEFNELLKAVEDPVKAMGK
jgi:PAS domain S-box-containing protein